MPKATDSAAETQDVVERVSFATQDMRNIESFDDAIALLVEAGIPVQDATDAIGDGFVLLDSKDKDKLVDVPCLFVTWSFNAGDYEGEYVAARVVAKLGNGTLGKYVVIDGGEGICKQLRDYTTEYGVSGGLKAFGGLTRSDYEKEIDGKMTPATTYYVNTSAK